jgi:hypothetical protein
LFRTFSGAGKVQNLSPAFRQQSRIFGLLVRSRTLLLASVVADAVFFVPEAFQVALPADGRGGVVVVFVGLVSFCEESFTFRESSSFRSASIASCRRWSGRRRITEIVINLHKLCWKNVRVVSRNYCFNYGITLKLKFVFNKNITFSETFSFKPFWFRF